MMQYRVPTGLAVLVAVLSSCAKRVVPIVEVTGECADLFKAQVCTWARTQGTAVIEVGATVPIASIENAPTVPGPMSWPPVNDAALKVPEIALAQTGLTHLTVYWEPMGHPPGAYLTPHFDFHFYNVSSAEQMAIDCKDLTEPSVLPAGYALPDVPLPPDMAKLMGVDTLVGLCVPQMGMHSAPAAELAATTAFRGTMVVGYYHRTPVFVEPMLSRAMLMEKRSFDLPVAAVPGMAAYPRTFHAEYDAQHQQYRFILSGFQPTN